MNTTVSRLVAAIAVVFIASFAITGCGPQEEPEVAVSGVLVSPGSIALELGGTANLTATVSPSNATNKTVTWSTSNQSVATVSGGTVTAVGEGTATITATAGGKTGNCTVTVSKNVIAVSTVALDQTAVELETGGTLTLVATVKPDDATDKTVTWSSSDDKVATVEDGVVTAVAVGSATVTAKSGDKEATCTVTVIPNEEDRIKAALMKIYDAMDGPNWKIQEGKWDTAKALDSWHGVEWKNKELKLTFEGEFGLKGEFPDCFDELTSCVRFWLQNEPGVTGTLPPSFSKLNHLGLLLIAYTSMTSLPDIFEGMPLWYVAINSNKSMTGPVPESLGSSDALLGNEKMDGIRSPFMSISENGFTGTVPQSWLRLGNHLGIYLHRFSGQIPDYFYTAENAGYMINMYINESDHENGYRKSDPFSIKDRDIPGYWPDREIKDVLTGKPIPYNEVVSKNKATVIFKWATWCGYSMALMPQLKQMYEKYHKAGLEIIARTTRENSEIKAQKDFLLEKGFDTWLNVSAGDFSFDEVFALGEYGTPFANVIDSKGNIIFSCAPDVSDPSRGRFNRVASSDLIPFLEDIFGPLEDDEVYSSTDYSQDGKVTTLQAATVGKGIDIVFMGDAYTDKDMVNGTYDLLMRQSMEEFFKIEPYKTFKDRFNVYAVKVVSKNGRTGDGYSTALGAKVEGSSISVTEAGQNKAFEYALKVPGIKDKKNLLINVLVNSSGGRGITSMLESLQSGVSWCASGNNMREAFGVLIRHEAGGHGFAFLADEYSTDNETPSQELIDKYNSLYNQYGMYSNIDFTDDPKKVKWSWFLSDERYKDEVGIYEGAGGPFSKGIYRPSMDSMMNHNAEYYNAPSRWAIYKRIMELSGETVSFDEFLKYDAINRGKKIRSLL